MQVNAATEATLSAPCPTRVERVAPLRRCVGCGQSAPQSELVRVVLGPEGEIAVDLAQRAFGRGAWLHARPVCVTRAAPRGLSRAFKCQVALRPEALLEALRAAALRRAGGLLIAASRAGQLVVGTDAATRAWQAGRVCLLVVSEDARAASHCPLAAEAASAGRAVRFGTNEALGAWLGRGPTALVAVLDDGLARALSRALGVARMSLQSIDSETTEDG